MYADAKPNDQLFWPPKPLNLTAQHTPSPTFPPKRITSYTTSTPHYSPHPIENTSSTVTNLLSANSYDLLKLPFRVKWSNQGSIQNILEFPSSTFRLILSQPPFIHLPHALPNIFQSLPPNWTITPLNTYAPPSCP